MIKKILISFGVLFSFFLMFLFGLDKINVLAINSFDSSIGSYNFNIDIENYDNINLVEWHNVNFVPNNSTITKSDSNGNLIVNLSNLGSSTYVGTYFYLGNYLKYDTNYNFSLSVISSRSGRFRIGYESSFCDIVVNANVETNLNCDFVFNNSSTAFVIYLYSSNIDNANQYFIVNDLMVIEGNETPNYYSSYFKFGYNVTGNLAILSTSSTSRNFTLNLCNKLARYDGNGFLIDGTPECFYTISRTINTTGLINIPINAFVPFNISEDGTISFDMEFYVAYGGNYYSDLYLCPYTTSNYSCSGTKSSLIFTPVLQGYYNGELSNNIIHSNMNYVSNNFYYKGFYLYGRGRYFNDSTNSYNYFDTKEYITFISKDVKTGANLTLDSSNNDSTWSINTNVASDYINSASYYNSININEFFNYSIDMSKFFEHNSHFTLGTATGDATINDYTMFWGFSSINTRVLDSNSSTTPLPGGSNLLNKYNTCSAWYDIPCQLGNAVTYVIYEAPIISPVLTFIVSFITMFSSLVSFVDLFKSFGIVFGCFIIYMFIELLHKYSK